MSAIGRFWVRLKRFRHRRGYGVHSPFAFNFLTYVVYERGEYYAYRDLAARHPVPFFRCGGHLAKCRKFLFRLANYVHPAVIRLVGGVGTAEADYLSAGCRSAAVVRTWRGRGRRPVCPGRKSWSAWGVTCRRTNGRSSWQGRALRIPPASLPASTGRPAAGRRGTR